MPFCEKKSLNNLPHAASVSVDLENFQPFSHFVTKSNYMDCEYIMNGAIT